MRFVYNDPRSLRNAVEQFVGQHAESQHLAEIPIPVDVYQDGNDIVIEGAIPGAGSASLELTCEDGLLTVRGEVESVAREFAVQEIPRGAFSRTLALPGECDIQHARASFENGIVRIVVPRQKPRVAHTIKVEVASNQADGSRIVMEKPGDVVDSIKGEGYREVDGRPARGKRRPK
ncbi:MAG TPA: Hsp20/alpha crystallin family protein [Candidatus Dormibacteraeota bacterium]|nr:Hsp20/alpha crystallin family protein [Candidatus Dormibacteraeota bacterium]